MPSVLDVEGPHLRHLVNKPVADREVDAGLLRSDRRDLESSDVLDHIRVQFESIAKPMDDAGPRAFAAARIVMADSGLSLSTTDLRITCSASRCLRPGSQVQVAVTYRVTLPLVPRFFADRAPASIRVTSHHLEVVDRYRAPAR